MNLKILIGPFSGTDGISPNERRIHTGADSDTAPHLMVSEPLPTGGLDGLVGFRGNPVRPRRMSPRKDEVQTCLAVCLSAALCGQAVKWAR